MADNDSDLRSKGIAPEEQYDREIQKPDEKNFGQEDFLENIKEPDVEEFDLESESEEDQKKEELLATKDDHIDSNDLTFVDEPSANFENLDVDKKNLKFYVKKLNEIK